jgi:hypothetical protein
MSKRIVVGCALLLGLALQASPASAATGPKAAVAAQWKAKFGPLPRGSQISFGFSIKPQQKLISVFGPGGNSIGFGKMSPGLGGRMKIELHKSR